MKPKTFIRTSNRFLRGEKLPVVLRLGLTVGLAVGFVFSPGGRAADSAAPPLEYRVKAAFLIKFATFTEWPVSVVPPVTAGDDSVRSPIKIGILGDDAVGNFFDGTVKIEQVKGRPVEVLHGRDISELAGCHVVYVAESEAARVAAVLQALAGKPVLTVADTPDFAPSGGMVGFIKEDGKVRFEINVAAAEQAGLKLSAKLLQVGKVVVPGRPRE